MTLVCNPCAEFQAGKREGRNYGGIPIHVCEQAIPGFEFVTDICPCGCILGEKSMAEEVTLGEKYRDEFSGFEGIAIARHEYVNGCVRYTLLGPAKDGGEPPEVYVDEEQLVEAESNEAPARTSTSGGSRPGPRPRSIGR